MKPRLAATALHVVVALLGVTAAYFPTLRSGFQRVQTDPGDTLLNAYLLEHTWQCVSNKQYVGSLWSPPFFHPARETLAYSENLLGAAPVYWVLRIACSDLLAFQLWMMVVSIGTYAGMAWALRSVGVSHVLCAAGGFVFAFGAARTNELAHQQLLPQMFGPMAVVAGWRFLREPQLRELIILVAGTTWQLFASIYVGWFFVLGLMLFLGVGIAVDVSAVRRFGTFFRIRWLSTGLILIAGAASLIWLFEPYVRVNRDFHRHFADCILPELHSWLAPPPDGIWSDTLASQRKGQDHVQWLFPGFTALGIFGLALLLLLTRARWLTFNDRALIATAVATVLLLVAITTRWPGGATAWRMAFRYLPGANGLRAVTRMFTSVYLFGLLGGTVALDRLLGRMNFSWRMPLSLVLLAAATAEQLHWNLPSFEKAPWLARVDAVRAGLAGHQAGYLRFDPALPYWENHLIAMWAGLKADVPVVNGFSGRWPPGYPDWSRSWNDDELKQWMAASGSDHVAVLNPDGSVRSILER